MSLFQYFLPRPPMALGATDPYSHARGGIPQALCRPQESRDDIVLANLLRDSYCCITAASHLANRVYCGITAGLRSEQGGPQSRASSSEGMLLAALQSTRRPGRPSTPSSEAAAAAEKPPDPCTTSSTREGMASTAACRSASLHMDKGNKVCGLMSGRG